MYDTQLAKNTQNDIVSTQAKLIRLFYTLSNCNDLAQDREIVLAIPPSATLIK